MISARLTQRGEHRKVKFDTSLEGVKRGERGGALDETVVRLLKAQDKRYLMTQRQINKAKLEGLRIETDTMAKPRHVHFVESKEEAKSIGERHAAVDQRIDGENESGEKTVLTEEQKVRLERVKKLDVAIRALEAQSQGTSRGRKQKVGQDVDGVPIYRFAPERQK